MSIHDCLHEKAAESRHNETLAFIMFLTGTIFGVGGIISSLVMSQEPSWFLFIPYIEGYTQATFLEILLLIIGLALCISGTAIGLHYYRDRNWYLQQLAKSKDDANRKPQRMQFGRLNYAPEVADTPKTNKTK